MKTFTIENGTNNITVHATTQDAEAVANAERFRNEPGLNKLAADWPAVRLVEIWNSLPGATPVKKFKDRQTAVGRIWKALQSLGHVVPADEQPPVAEPAPIQEATQASEPAAAIPDEPEAPTATTLRHKRPTSRRQRLPRRRRPPPARARPKPRKPPRGHARAARPPKSSQCFNARKARRSARLWHPWDGRSTRSAGSWREL